MRLSIKRQAYALPLAHLIADYAKRIAADNTATRERISAANNANAKAQHDIYAALTATA